MKYLLVFGLLAFASCQANLAGLDCDYVPQKAALIRDLQVNYFADVVRAQGSCGNEFSAYGTCCSIDSLKAKAAKLQASLTSGIAQLKSEFVSFADAIQKVDVQLSQLINGKVQGSDEAYNSKVAIARGIFNSRAWFFLKSNFANTTQQGQDFNNSLDSCWPLVSGIRTSSLCALCSGRSNAFVTNAAGSQTYQVVISNSDCLSVSNNCATSLRRLRTLSQAVYLYSKFVAPALLSGLGIFSDNHKVDQLRLTRLNAYLTAGSLQVSLNNSDFNLDIGRAGVCSAVLSAGKPTLVEALAQVFQANTSYGVFDINAPLSPNQQQAVVASDNLEDALSAGVKTGGVGQPASSADSTNITSIIGGLVSSFRAFEMNRRRRLQGGDSTFLDAVTLQSYVDELRAVSAGKVLESASLIPTPIVTGADQFSGDLVERYISNQLSVVSDAGLQVSGFTTRAYDSPPADNPPVFSVKILDPVMFTPINLVL